MKAVLVIDMPKDCRRCQLMVDRFCYGIPADEVHGDININERPSWCPLKTLPKQFTMDEILMTKDVKTAIEMRAYNDCLEEIMGETE